METKMISELPAVSEIPDSAHVLVESNGAAKRVPASAFASAPGNALIVSFDMSVGKIDCEYSELLERKQPVYLAAPIDDTGTIVYMPLVAINEQYAVFATTIMGALQNCYIDSSGSMVDGSTTEIPTNTNQLENGAGYITGAEAQEICEQAITTLPDASVPDYVITEAETVARIVNQHQSGDSIVFPFLTDAHCGYYTDKTNAATTLAGQLLDQIGQRVPYDFIANGGDMANGAYDTTREMTYEQYEDYTQLTSAAHKGVPSVWCPGNHDDAPYMATADRATQTDVFALIGRKSRLSGAICPNGCSYGYLDLENRKLRVIYLDTDDKRSWGTVQVGSGGTAPAYLNAHNVGGDQLRWLANTALDFTGKENAADWDIVVVSHVSLDASGTITDAVSGTTYTHSTANAATILSAYASGGSGSITHNGATVPYDFSALEARASVICCVHGHNHKFTHGTVGGILSIGCPNVMNGRERESADGNTYTKTAGTADGTSFCILTIDRENQMIYADCVGAGYDREFEYTTEVVSYTNLLPISTDADGNVYDGKGWKADTYLSSGTDGTSSGIYASGFLPIEWNAYGNAVFHCKNVGMQTGQDKHRISIYDADKAHINTVKTTVTSGWWTWGTDGNIEKITVLGANFSTAKYIRLCCGYLGDDSIITINEEIA